MSKITEQEVIKIAAMSNIEIARDGMDSLIKQLEDVLNYAARVTEIAADVDDVSTKNINVFREDIIIPSDAQSIMKEAPESESNYFVVPKIVDGAK